MALGLLLHPADLLFMFGLFAVMFGGAVLLILVLASRARRRRKIRPHVVEGVNRAQRRKEIAETRRRRR